MTAFSHLQIPVLRHLCISWGGRRRLRKHCSDTHRWPLVKVKKCRERQTLMVNKEPTVSLAIRSHQHQITSSCTENKECSGHVQQIACNFRLRMRSFLSFYGSINDFVIEKHWIHFCEQTLSVWNVAVILPNLWETTVFEKKKVFNEIQWHLFRSQNQKTSWHKTLILR